MFTQPINQSGLSGFIPVRRQEGGVPNQELDIGQIADNRLNFNIFGQRIAGGPIAQTTTNIGQIENPQQLAPGLPQGGISSLIPVDGGADDPFQGAPDFTPPDVSLPDFSLPGLDDVVDKVSNIPEAIGEAFEGKDGSFFTSPVAANIAGSFAKTATTTALSNMGRTGAIVTGPLGNLVSSIVSQKVANPDKDLDVPELAFQTGLGFLAAVFPPLAIPIMLFNLIRSFWGEDEGLDAEGLETMGHNIDMDIAPPGTFGPEPGPIYTGSYSEPESPVDLEDMGYNIDMDIGPPGTFSGPAPTGGPSGGPDGGSDAGGDVGSDPGSTACWVAGTQILMADNTYRNIEDLKIGDMVMSYPETKKTRRWNTPLEAKPIVSLLVDVHPEIWHLNDSMVSGTEWMIKEDGTAAIVQWLNVGDTVLGPDNNLVEITRVEPAEGQLKKQVIYNFETKDNYTYIADGMRTIRGRAIRGEYAPSAGRVYQVMQTYLSGDTNSYEGSMQDEYNKKFSNLAA